MVRIDIIMPNAIIETPRLILRQWKESDQDPYIRLNSDLEVMEFFPSVKTPTETLAQIKKIAAYIGQHGYGFFAVERKDNHQFIGFTGVCEPGFDAYFTPCIEIGWRLSKENWGQGFATEAALACLDFGFDKLNLAAIYSFTSIHNKRSEKVMQRIGMSKTGEFDHPSIADGHWLKRHTVYKISSAPKL
ncbi:GNAT family N-acetyltransferase [Mucilaginibacter sp. BT774]|uniref:GNAT family N-acetyltransferase n=1 Tax=Mucilaginibacter sp. BT774 TaxID=3062276 RepID=UPI002676C91E|nr:GNAT family N-acetyltransferase [Mucilaginibacter sp. BT774]MDO3628125.1 GNAT family N-acetyltransferase [Mucilaginibacter sp. BT774]